MKVQISAEAEADIRAIGRYIARDDPVRAGSFVVEIETRLADLAYMPKRFQSLSRQGADPSIHHFVHRRYRIYYSVSDADALVEILTVRHSAQDVSDLPL